MKKLTLACFAMAMIASASLFATEVKSSDFTQVVDFLISGYNGTTSLENFPVAVRFSHDNPIGFDYDNVAQTKEEAYEKIRFADIDANSLNFEIDTWNPEGESVIWVSIPCVTGVKTKFRAFMGARDDAELPENNPEAVWSSAGYIGVWHMNEIVSEGAAVADSSGNGYTATAKIASAYPTLSSDNSMFGAAIKGTSSGGLFLPDDVLKAYNTDEDRMQDHYSAEGWVNRDRNWTSEIIFSTGQSWNTGAQVGLGGYLYGNAHHNSQNNIIPGEGWVFISAAWASNDNAAYLFCGAESLNAGAGDFVHKNLNRTDTNTDFSRFSLNSYASDDNGGSSFRGYMDEFRLRKIASSQDWTQAVYDSGKQGSTFLSKANVAFISESITGNFGSAPKVGSTTATIVGVFVGDELQNYTATYTLLSGGEVVREDVPAGSLSNFGYIEIELDDLEINTRYEFLITVMNNGRPVYSSGEFTTQGLVKPEIKQIGETSATVTLGVDVEGASYEAGKATAIFVPAGNGKSISVTPYYRDGEWVAEATTLEEDMDYIVKFIFEPIGLEVLETEYSDILTTKGVAKISNTAFGKYMDITISGYDGEEELEYFPVLLRIPSEIASEISDVTEIRFVNDAGTLLAHEIECWNPEGESCIWVSVNKIVGRTTTIKMLWDINAGKIVHGSYSPARIWKQAGYVGVWHFSTQNSDGSFPDASGNGATAVPVFNTTNPGVCTNDIVSANGTTWQFVKSGVKVEPKATTEWLFDETGYTTETWMIPSANYNRMFLYSNSNNEGNALALGLTQFYVMTGDYDQGMWSEDISNTSNWRFITTSWIASSAPETEQTSFYVNGEKVRTWTWKHAVSFKPNGMGLTSGINGNGSGNFNVDEIRVRRGTSSEDWVQANHDTQRLGTDFVTYGDIVEVPTGTIIIIY